MTTVKKVDKWPDNDVWAKAQKEWDETPEAEKAAFRKENAAAIDRWQSETDALADTSEDETSKGAE